MPPRIDTRFKVQRGLSGLGLFAGEPLARGALVIEYRGPLLTEEQANEKGGSYLFAVTDTKWTIDGSSRENLARYINHSCKPNCEAVADGNRILIYAKQRISPGEELTYDYGKEFMEEIITAGKCRCSRCAQ